MSVDPHRYWRILCLTNTGAYAFDEIEMATTVGGANECTGGTATASSSNTSRGPDRAFNGATGGTSFWMTSSAGEQWIQYDFGVGNAKAIKEIRLFPNSTSSNKVTSFSVQYSDDGVVFTTEATYEQPVWNNGVFEAFPRRAYETGFRYQRVLVTAVTGGAARVEIRSLEFAEEVGGPTVCVGGFPTASSSIRAASNAFTVDLVTSIHFWSSSGNAPQWLMYDFGMDGHPEVVEARMSCDTSDSNQPTDFQFQRSNDGVTWETWKTVAGWIFPAEKTIYSFTGDDPPPSGKKRRSLVLAL